MKASLTLLALATSAFANGIVERGEPAEYLTTEVAVSYTTVCPVTETSTISGSTYSKFRTFVSVHWIKLILELSFCVYDDFSS